MEDYKLKLLTWNATGIMSSASYLCKTLTYLHINICGISGHWLLHNSVHFLDSAFKNYRYIVKCDNDLLLPSKRKIGKGGVALLWRHELNDRVSPLEIDDRITGLQLQISPSNYVFIFQVYLPCTNHSNVIYRDYAQGHLRIILYILQIYIQGIQL